MEAYNLGIFLLMWGIAFLLTRLGLSAMFEKAGENKWLAFIPIFSWWIWIKIVGRPKWYMIGMVIPCINILFSFNITLDILRAFGQFKFWQQLVGIVLSFLYFPFLFLTRSKLTYLGQSGTAEWKQKHLGHIKGGREWADAILFAMYVAGGMRGLYFDLFQIPTSSMESNMLVGDFLLVNRTSIGMRIPMTPVTVPAIAHQELPFGGIKAYSDIIQLPYMRLPGWHTIKNNDIVVFNVPYMVQDLKPENKHEVDFPADKKTYFVKRCVGVPGNTLEVRNRQVYIDGKALPFVGKAQRRYLLKFKKGNVATVDFMKEHHLGDINTLFSTEEYLKNIDRFNPEALEIVMINTWEKNIAEIKSDPTVQSVEAFDDTTNMVGFFHPNNNEHWNLINYGKIYLPKRGETVKLNLQNVRFYTRAIELYEKQKIAIVNNKIYINDQETDSYTFQYGYYWMMGDNRDASEDSRVWGMVPENHIVGIPSFAFLSLHKVSNLDENNVPIGREYQTIGIHWDRIFKFFE